MQDLAQSLGADIELLSGQAKTTHNFASNEIQFNIICRKNSESTGIKGPGDV